MYVCVRRRKMRTYGCEFPEIPPKTLQYSKHKSPRLLKHTQDKAVLRFMHLRTHTQTHTHLYKKPASISLQAHFGHRDDHTHSFAFMCLHTPRDIMCVFSCAHVFIRVCVCARMICIPVYHNGTGCSTNPGL